MLPTNGQSTIAGRVGCTPSYVSMVLSAKRNSFKVLKTALELIEENKAESRKLKEIFSKLQ